jgi:uncharacterized 2Fe-2S/4Fe-4S cluster protein (DUF4445 family)
MSREIQVAFQPSGRRVFVLPGTIVIEAAARAGFIVDTPCGGAGKCGKCRVRIMDGKCDVSDAARALLGTESVEDGFRLGCQARITEAMTIEIPNSSLFGARQQILEEGVGGGSFELCPIDVNLDEVKGPCCGVSFDIGTSTLVGTMVDLRTGLDLAVCSRANPQTSFGDDVISRITRCRETESGLEELQATVLSAIREMLAELGNAANVGLDCILTVVLAGNSTMEQILCGIDPSPLGEMPFLSLSTAAERMAASDLGLKINAAGRVYVLPQIASFIGGDTVAGVLSSRLDEYTRPALFIDIGTNGELVLACDKKLVSASVAAGPAFEGARIVNGMRATTGAIEKVVFGDDVLVNTIEDAAAAGICGTGLVDLVAEMLRAGILDTTGRILSPDELDGSVPDGIHKRLVEADGASAFRLVDADATASGDALHIYQKDIREVQLANGAIRAGINLLLKMAGIEFSDLEVVLIAGAFGNFIRRKNAKRIGMLPPVSSTSIRYIGNTASSGAKSILLSSHERDRAEQLAVQIEHADLSLDPEFQMQFGEAMLFPESEPA